LRNFSMQGLYHNRIISSIHSIHNQPCRNARLTDPSKIDSCSNATFTPAPSDDTGIRKFLV